MFDIDKIYLMFYEVSDKGKIIGWSNYFNYNTPLTLKESLNLSNPSGKIYSTLEDNSEESLINDKLLTTLSVYSELINIKDEVSQNELFPEFVEAINKLSQNTTIKVSNQDENIIKGLEVLNDYNLHIVPERFRKDALRNSITSKIYRISMDLKNLFSAERPVDMNEPQEAALKSLKGKRAQQMTTYNYMSIPIMQYQNAAGKDVIGISAVGEKVFFGLSYYINKMIREGKDLDKLPFTKIHNIKGTTYISNLLANINFNEDKLKPILEEYYSDLENKSNELKTNDNIVKILGYGAQEDASIVISALLSASTDNAKELILDKINAGPDLAKVYLYGIMLGMDFSTISDLMISPTVNEIVNLSRKYAYDETTSFNSIDRTLKMLESGINPYTWLSNDVKKYINDWLYDYNGFTGDLKDTIDDYIIKQQEESNNNISYDNQQYRKSDLLKYVINNVSNDGLSQLSQISNIEFIGGIQITNNSSFDQDFVDFDYDEIVDEIGYGSNKTYFNTTFQRMLKRVKELNSTKSKINPEDLESFKNLYEKSDEMSFIGRLFSINQGVKTDLPSEIKFKNLLKDRIITKEMKITSDSNNTSDQFKALDDTNKLQNFDINQFFMDANYANELIDLYETAMEPGSINLLRLIYNIPHFKSMYEASISGDNMLKNLSVRYKTLESLYKPSMTQDEIKIINNFIEDIIIKKWFSYLSNSGYRINIPSSNNNMGLNNTIFNNFGEMININSDTNINLNTPEGLASFKLYMEQFVIPNLKSGIILNNRNLMKIDGLSDNEFVKNIILDDSKNRFTGKNYNFYKLPLNMSSIETETEKAIYEDYSIGFSELSNIKFNSVPIQDLFFIYNMIINKNHFGGNSLTKLFESNLDMKKTSLIQNYFSYVGNLDYQNNILEEGKDYELSDLNFAIAPQKRLGDLKNLAKQNKHEWVKVWNHGENEYYRLFHELDNEGNIKNSTYELYDFIDLSSNYFLDILPSYSKLMYRGSSNINDDNQLRETLMNKISNNNIIIVVNC